MWNTRRGSRRAFVLLAVLGLTHPGCNERVTNDDVEAARREAEEQRREAIEVKTQAPRDAAAVRKHETEARDAELKLKETELKAAATTARDAFVRGAEALLAEVDRRTGELRSAASNQDETSRSAANVKITDLEERSDRAARSLRELQAADLLLWDQHRGQVQRQLDELRAAIR